MMKAKQISHIGIIVAAFAFLVSMQVETRADAGFQRWINDFYPVAARSGISKNTYQTAFKDVRKPDHRVLEKATNQPEFKSTAWDYLDARVNPYTVKNGRKMARKHRKTLAAIERHFGIDRSVLLAIWSMESNYGEILTKKDRLHHVPTALATLAYADRRRARFARQQLVAALKILEKGDVKADQLTGSWAVAMGHTQFIPTSYLAYAVDADGNGHRDIWTSVPDALATAANLLDKNGWQTGKTWGYEVIVPSGAARYAEETKTLKEWRKLGFKRANGKGFPRADERAELKMPAGANGPGFLMLRNFFVIKKYNNSDLYALAVGLLADEIAGHGGMKQRWPRPQDSLELTEKFEIQERLKRLGYYDGAIDGNLGSGSQAAIRAFQTRKGLKVDGRPSQPLLRALRDR